jgi:hypothetical protein
VLVDDAPEVPASGVNRLALEQQAAGAVEQRAAGRIGMADLPADIGGAANTSPGSMP